MAGIKDSAVGTKTSHVLNQLWMGLKRGAQIGAVGGAMIGVGTVLFGSAAITIPAVLGYAAFGAVAGSMFGMNTGGFIGGIKGLITRSKPNGDKLVKEAEACATQEGPAAPTVEPVVEKEQAVSKAPESKAPQTQDPNKAPVASAVSVSTPDAAVKATGDVPKEALAELKAMTETLNQIQGGAAVKEGAAKEGVPPAPQQDAQPQQNWQNRVQQSAAQADMTERQR